MLLTAHFVAYKDAIQTYVYCPEIDFAESGELIKDAEANFYKHYPIHLDSLFFEGILEKFLIENGWTRTGEELACPVYTYKSAVDFLIERKLGEYSEHFHFLGKLHQTTIAIPIHGDTNNRLVRNLQFST